MGTECWILEKIRAAFLDILLAADGLYIDWDIGIIGGRTWEGLGVQWWGSGSGISNKCGMLGIKGDGLSILNKL
jgi:hypothetical protein